MIRTDEWKYIVYPQARQEQLFRLSDDPHELHNRIHDPDCRAIAAELRRRLTEWRRRHDDPTLTPAPGWEG
jgi:arylsulfatase A-like enzyme